MAMSRLKVGQVLLMSPDGLLKLLDVLGATFPKSCLGLTVSLLSLFGSRIDLQVLVSSMVMHDLNSAARWA